MADRSGQTEEPTQRRMQKAREEGQFPAAREFVSALQFMVFLALLGAGAAGWFGQLRVVTAWLFSLAFARELGPEDLTQVAWRVVQQLILPLMIAGLGVAVAALAFRLVTTRFGFSLKKLAPDLGRLNPAAKLRELPRQNLPALVQALVLLPVFLWAVYVVARDHLDAFLALPMGSVEGGVALLCHSLMDPVLEGGRRVPGVRGGGSLPPVAEAPAGSAHEQAGYQGRDEGDGGQSADEGPYPPNSARPGPPADDEGGPQGHRRGGQSDALRGRHPLPVGQHGGAPGSGQGQELPGAANPREGASKTRCPSSRIHPWRRRSTTRWTWARRFRRTSIAR